MQNTEQLVVKSCPHDPWLGDIGKAGNFLQALRVCVFFVSIFLHHPGIVVARRNRQRRLVMSIEIYVAF